MSIKLIIIETIEYIENNLKEELTAEILAKTVGYSKVHFSRLFIFVTGTTIYDYIVSRRLVHAAKEIQIAKNISQVLFDYGFDTQTGFNKAFKRKFGMTPKAFKEINDIRIPSLIIKEMIKNEIKGEILMEPRIIKKDKFCLIGYSIITKNVEGENNTDIARFWNEYMSDGRMEKLHSQEFVSNQAEYGACLPVDANGNFKYLIAVETKNAKNILNEFVTYNVNEQEYAVFTTPKANTHTFTQKIQQTWNFIFEKWLPHSPYSYDSNGIDFELYDERCYADDGKVIDIYIPIKQRDIIHE